METGTIRSDFNSTEYDHALGAYLLATSDELQDLLYDHARMKGTRPLDNNEIMLVSACFDGLFEVRNRGLFMLGVSTGGRINERYQVCLYRGKFIRDNHARAFSLIIYNQLEILDIYHTVLLSPSKIVFSLRLRHSRSVCCSRLFAPVLRI